MKILVFGCGVIGSYLVHVLCEAGNDVTVVARGQWRQVLDEKGLYIHHKLQRKDTVNHPRVISEVDESTLYDLVFSVMQGQQQKRLFPELLRVNAPIAVLVGNNLEAEAFESEYTRLTRAKRSLLFGFQGTAGLREADRVICVRFGNGSLNVGGVHREATEKEKTVLARAFSGTSYQLKWTDDMMGWLYCHAAFILPIVYLSYACGCNLRKASGRQIRDGLKAAEEGYGLIARAGILIRPEGDEKTFESVPKMLMTRGLMHLIARTSVGELAVTDHCRNAVDEMEWLDTCFERLHGAFSDFQMPTWEALRKAMPAWEEIHMTYDRQRK